jgi:hypothetical protein
LEKEGLFSVDALQGRSLEELLAIPAFGVKCLVDLLTAVEAANAFDKEDAACADPTAKTPEPFEAGTLAPRLTREARLLGNEPWSKDVSLYDIRLGSFLLRDEEAFKEVQEALVTGRIALEQRLCTELPRWDIDLLRCPLQSRTRNCLREAGLTTLSALASRTLSDMTGLAGLGDQSLVDLLALLDICRFLTSASAPVDREPTLADFCDAIINRTRDSWFPERLADRIHRTRAKGILCRSLSLEEELRGLTASISPHSGDVVIEYLGWGGQGPRTLEAVGNAKGLTKERVRQKVSKLIARLSEVSAWTPILCRALEFCDRVCPQPAEEIATLLQQNELAAVPFHPHGLLTSSEALGLTHPFSLRCFEGVDWLFRADQEALLRKSVQISRSIIAKHGVCSLGDLQGEMSEQTSQSVSEERLRDWLLRLPGIQWMDLDRLWFRLPTEGSSLETMLWKIMAVAPEIRLGELREGLMRHYRSPSPPPSAVLRQLCGCLGLEVHGDVIRAGKVIHPEEALTEVEFTFFDLLSTEGPLLPSGKLEKRCLQRGMNRSTFWVYLMYSPILARYADGIYGLRGAHFAPGEAEALRPRHGRSRIVVDYG